MKKVFFALLLIINGHTLIAQLNSGTISVPPAAQPVPNATAKEKAATPQPQNVAPAPNPIPPIYPGADVKAAETQRQLVYPPSTPSGTQPVQKEPLSPIESTNTLQPNRPQREENSRENPAVAAPYNSAKPNNNVKQVPVKTDEPVKTTIKTINNNSTYIKTSGTNTKQKVETKRVNKKTVAVKKLVPKN